MKQAAWKRFISFFNEIHIESAPSEHNPHLYVSLSRGRYQLCTANAVYSFEDLYDNFALAFAKMDLENLPIKKVLILGFGLGSIPQILEQLFKKDYEYTAVEIDESVLYLANKYTLPAIKSSIEIICADAFSYIQQSTEKFDMIAMDVFLDDIIPPAFQEASLLKKLQNMLTPKGVLLYNCLAFNKSDLKKTNTFYKKTFKKIFPNGTYLNVNGNWILLNSKNCLKSQL